MYKNYFKIAARNLWRNKTFSFINIFGLAFGLTCCLLMILFIKNELNYDRFNKNANAIYRVAFSDYLNMGGHATTQLPIGPALKEQMPEVKAVARINYQDPYLMKYENNEYFEPISFADEDVFKIFSFPLVEGDPNTALKEPNSIVISQQMAIKYHHSMVSVSYGRNNCFGDYIMHNKFPGGKDRINQSREEFKNGIKPTSKKFIL